MKYYSKKNIDKTGAKYRMIIGERSNGKTFSCLTGAIHEYFNNGKQSIYLRRWEEAIKGKRANILFDDVVSKGFVEKITNGEWTGVTYYNSRWYLSKKDIDTGKTVKDDTPFMYGIAITGMENDKSISYPNVTTVIFDEFLTRGHYLPDEFILFCNALSTIIRERDDVIIYMLGNTVNKYCPYFREMGLDNVLKMKQGTIDIYQYGDSGLTVAVEYCSPTKGGKKSDIYFAFSNPRLAMIKGGEWELDIYPHLPYKYKDTDVLTTFYVEFDGQYMSADIVSTDDTFIFLKPKTTDLHFDDGDIIFSQTPNPSMYVINNPYKSPFPNVRKIMTLVENGKIFYASNDTGELWTNYLKSLVKF